LIRGGLLPAEALGAAIAGKIGVEDIAREGGLEGLPGPDGEIGRRSGLKIV
jgi:hypothetical protein